MTYMKQVYWILKELLAGRCGPDCMPWKPEELYAGGIRGIVSLDSLSVDEKHLQNAGLQHLPCYQPMMYLENEAQQRRFLEALPPIFRFIDRHRQEQSAVLVHCYFGCDRTGTVLACYLVSREGLPAEEAINSIRAVQPQAMLADGYCAAVRLFDQERPSF
jgi:atypical dual specificity phosphatase